jgi:hypothetical protein
LNRSSIHILVLVQHVVDPLSDKGLDSAVSFAQSLSQWAYITIGASVALLLKDLAQRPKSRFVRWSFLTFVPGWIFLGRAISKGVRVHGAYIAYLMNPNHEVSTAIQYINVDAAAQLSNLKCGLVIFFLWLVIYLLWWITHPDRPRSNETINLP